MKQRFLSLCVAIVMILTTVLGTVPAPVVQAAELPDTIVVEGSEITIGSYLTDYGTETTSDGKTVNYCHIQGGQWSNGQCTVTFTVAGKYQMGFLAAVKAAPTNFHIELKGLEGDFGQIMDGAFFEVTEKDDSYNTYTEFAGGPVVTIEEPGTYTFKIGSWAQGADFKLAEVRFTAVELIEPYNPDKVYEVRADAQTEILTGPLKKGIEVGSYVDYKLNVAEEGDYTLTYTMGQNSSTFGESGEAFQAILNPEDEAPAEYPAMIITTYWQDLPIKQTIHLSKGEQVLRVKALAAGFTIKNIAVNSRTVNVIAEAENVIPAAQYENADNYHAIEANGNLGYTSEGLKVDYAVNVEKSGTYTVSYEYVSRYAASLETQIDGVKAAESALDASTASGNWYDADYADSDTTGISFRLEKGMHTLSTLWSSADINVKSISLICKTPDPDPITLEVEAEKLSGGSYSVSEVAAAGDEPAHLQISTTQYANGRWIQNFPYAGQYKVQFVVKTPTDFNKINFYMGATSGEDSSLADNDGAWVQYGGNIALSSTNGEWATVDGPVVEISEPGYYDIKFGNWAAGPEAFLLDKILFTCDSPIAPPSTDEPLIVEKGKSLVLKEALAVEKKGSLKANVSSGDYVDYAVEVKEAGDYRLTYTIGANSDAVEDAFQVQVAPQKEELTDADFTTKLEPVQMTHYYATIQERQSIHLEAGSYILRTKALNEGFTLTQLVISDAVTFDVKDDGTATSINAVEYNNGIGYHAIQNATTPGTGNIGYAAQGLGLDYEVNIAQGGVYNIVYSYQANGDYTLTTQRVADGQVYDLATSQLVKSVGTTNWYDCDVTSSEAAAILLPAGKNTIRVHWDQADINLHAFSLAYQGSAVQYVVNQLTALPDKSALTLADEAAVNKAKNSYDTLTDEEKAQISGALLTKLNEDLAQIPVLQLAKTVADNKADLEKEFSKYQESEYRAEKWAEVVAAKDAGLEAIGKAATIAEANKELRDAKAAMAAVVKKLRSIAITADGTVILAQSKAYRKNGFLNSNVAIGNFADYYVDVKEAGVYTFTYALYADEATEDAFAVKYDENEYPETVTKEYVKVSVPKIDVEGSLVKEIRGTVTLVAGEQTLRFEALSDKVRLNRITIRKQKTAEVGTMEPGEANTVNASDFAAATGSYILANNVVTGTAEGTALDYLVSIPQETAGFVSFDYAYAGSKEPELELAVVAADGTVTKLASVKAAATDGEFVTSDQAAVVLPGGDYTLRITMKHDGVDLKNLAVSGDQKNIPATGIQLNVREVNLNLEGTFQLAGTLAPENTTASITWSSSDETVAKVDSTGLVTAVKAGTAVITAAAADGVTAQCTVNVNKNEQGTSNPGKVPSFIAKVGTQFEKTTLYAGGNADKTVTAQLVIPTGAALAKAEYVSGNAGVATVSASGVVTAKKAGKAVITVKVTLTNGESASLQKQITVKKAYIKLKKANYSVKKGKSVQLKATAFGSSKKVTFKITDKKSKKLAKVTKTGKLTGKAKGTVKVIAQAGKVKKTFKVKVK